MQISQENRVNKIEQNQEQIELQAQKPEQKQDIDLIQLKASLEEKRQLMNLLEQGGYHNFGTVMEDVNQAIQDLDAIINELELCPEQS
ncbi:MAG: hypothetical protein ABH859_00495 [Pseudomonadota bacterium]